MEKIKLFINREENIIGYEKILDEENIYKSDIVISCDKEEMKMIKDGMVGHDVYYKNGKVVKGEKSAAWKERAEAVVAVKNPDVYKEFSQALINGKNIMEAITEVQEMKKAADISSKLLDDIVKRQEKEEMGYWNGIHTKEESGKTWKYYSSVCLLIRDENRYLDEWLLWYEEKGFDHIYIYDNGEKETVSDIITAEKNEKITIIPWHGEFANVQEDAYNDFMQNHGKETRWVIFLDSDEFVSFPKDSKVNTYLKKNEAYTNIKVSFIEYNANGQEYYSEEPVRERFKTTTDIFSYLYFKNFVQPFRIDKMYKHYPRYSQLGNYTLEPGKDDVVIEHYYTKSWEEWQKKIARGSSDPDRVKRLNEFFAYNPEMSYLKGEDVAQEYRN